MLGWSMPRISLDKDKDSENISTARVKSPRWAAHRATEREGERNGGRDKGRDG